VFSFASPLKRICTATVHNTLLHEYRSHRLLQLKLETQWIATRAVSIIASALSANKRFFSDFISRPSGPGPSRLDPPLQNLYYNVWNIRKKSRFMQLISLKMIGASLSEPHTSVTALRTCVCMYVCMSVCTVCRPYTENFKWARWNFNITKIELDVWCLCSLKARVQRRLLGVELTEVEVHMATYSRRQVAHRQYKFDHDGSWG